MSAQGAPTGRSFPLTEIRDDSADQIHVLNHSSEGQSHE